MVDSLAFERRGTPVMAFAVDSLARTVGRAMRRAHGYPDYPLVEIPAPFFESVAPSDEEFERKIVPAVERGLEILFSEGLRSAPAGSPAVAAAPGR